MSVLKRREISIGIFILCIFIVLFAEYTGIGQNVSGQIMIAVTMIINFTLVLGFYNLFGHHARIIIRRQTPDSYYSLILIATFLIYTGLQYFWPISYDWTVTMIFTPLMMAVTMLEFTMLTMIWRGARVRNVFALVVIVTAAIIMIQQSIIGNQIRPLWNLGNWILNVPNRAVVRGITILAGVGIIITLVRALLGYERSYLGEVT
jgi:hypothetical protein